MGSLFGLGSGGIPKEPTIAFVLAYNPDDREARPSEPSKTPLTQEKKELQQLISEF